MTDPFARYGALIARWRWLVLALWLVALPLVVIFGTSKAPDALAGVNFDTAGSDSLQAAEALTREFGRDDKTAIVVFHSPSLTVDDPAYQTDVTTGAERLATVPHVRSVTAFYQTRNPALVSPDRRTTLAVVRLEGTESEVEEQVEPLRQQLEGLSLEHHVTGSVAIGHDIAVTSESDLRRAEFTTLPIVVVLLLLVFRTVISAAIPLVLGACSVVLGIALLYPIAIRTDVSVFALNVLSMLGLGLGIDFSLIVVNRYREELAAGRDPRMAVAVTMATAGRSITYSGITVILGMLALTLMLNLMLVRSMSLAVMLVAITALVAGLTLLPAILAILGRRIEWLPVLPRHQPAQPGQEGFWYRLSHAIMRRPWIWLAVSLLVIVALAVPVKDLDVRGANADVLPKALDSVQGSTLMRESFGAGRLSPIEIVIETGQQDGVWKPEFLEALAQTVGQLEADPRVQGVTSVLALAPNVPRDQVRTLTPQPFTSDPGRAAATSQFVNLERGATAAVITVAPQTGPYDAEHEGLVRDLRGTILPGVQQLRAYEVSVGGDSATFIDASDSLNRRFPWLVLVTGLLTFVTLMMFFQSLFLPLKAILMNLASILASYGVLVMVFQYGWGASLLDFDPLGALNLTTPVILFVILLGLSTDYEVFMLSRVKEYYHETGNNEEAVAAGLESTARVITAAGLILIGTFGSFALAKSLVIKEVGLGLAVGVLLDSTIVRAIMVPATMRLAGRANWWMPAWLKRIVPELREGPAPDLVPAPAGVAVAAAAPVPSAAALPPRQVPPLQPASPTAPERQRQPYQPPAAPLVGLLRPTGGSVGTELIRLPRTRPFRIGRDSQAELWLYDQRISRYHARIDYDPQVRGFVVSDQGSANGVYVNGHRITSPTLLRSGDRLEIGTVGDATFVFEASPDGQPAALAGRGGA